MTDSTDGRHSRSMRAQSDRLGETPLDKSHGCSSRSTARSDALSRARHVLCAMDGSKPVSWRAVMLVVACLTALATPRASAQQESSTPPAEPPTSGTIKQGPGEEITATWQATQTAVEEIQLTIHKSVRVQLSRPIVRAFVTSPEMVTIQVISPTELLLSGKAAGVTQLMVWSDDNTNLMLGVYVGIEMERLRQTISRVAPQSNIRIDSVLGTLVLSGSVTDADTAQRVLQIAQIFTQSEVQNHLTIAGEPQVLLRVTIAEMDRSATRQLGINGFLAGDDFQDIFVLNNIGGINPSNIGAAAAVNSQATIPFLTAEGGIPVTDATTLSLGFPRVQMQLFLQALKENGLARILAEPNLVAISGQSAEFLAGGEFPIPVPQGGAGGSTSITIEYREFGAQLRFTPAVLGGGRIRLTVNPVISELDFTNALNISSFAVPGLTSRSAETTVEVGDGQTIVIAGLLSDSIRAISTKIPGLGEMPVLGALFRSVRYQRDITELVIMVTPEIVAPLNPDQVPPVPGGDIVDPNDFELYGLGLLQSGGDPVSGSLYGPGNGGNAAADADAATLDQVAAGSPGRSPLGTWAQVPPAGGMRGSNGQPVANNNILGPWGPANTAEEAVGIPSGP